MTDDTSHKLPVIRPWKLKVAPYDSDPFPCLSNSMSDFRDMSVVDVLPPPVN